jgi:hypothetical protein
MQKFSILKMNTQLKEWFDKQEQTAKAKQDVQKEAYLIKFGLCKYSKPHTLFKTGCKFGQTE